MNREPTPQINYKELELISTYLDGQLSESQMKQVRQRLSQDAAFKQLYDELRLTRRALRSAPRIKRRRSFTLTPQMVGKPARSWSLQRASGFMAAAATVLLAVVFAGDMFLGRGRAQFAMMDEANYAADIAMEDSIEMESMSVEPSGGGAEAPLYAAVPAEPAVESDADAAAEETADDSAGDQQNLASPTATALPTPTLAAAGTSAPEYSRAVPTDQVDTQEGIGAAETQKIGEADGEAVEESLGFIEPETPDGESTIFEKFGELPLITLVELALLSLAIGSGAVALVLRRGRG